MSVRLNESKHLRAKISSTWLETKLSIATNEIWDVYLLDKYLRYVSAISNMTLVESQRNCPAKQTFCKTQTALCLPVALSFSSVHRCLYKCISKTRISDSKLLEILKYKIFMCWFQTIYRPTRVHNMFLLSVNFFITPEVLKSGRFAILIENIFKSRKLAWPVLMWITACCYWWE
jgi:hypothetical protein